MRKIKTYIAVIILFIIQITCSNILNIAHCIPNLLLIFAICYSVISNLSAEGVVVCAVCGFLADISGGFPWGVSSVIFVLIYFMCSFVGGKFYRAKLPVSIIFSFVITFIYESGGFLGLMLSGTDVTYGISIVRVILPECIYHVIITPIMFWIVNRYMGEELSVDTDMD